MSIASMSIASIQRINSIDERSVGSGAPSVDSWERHHVMVSYLYGRILSNRWLSNTRTPADTPTSNIDNYSCGGILLRQSRGVYVSQPVGLAPELLAAVQKLNVEVAFTMSTEITDLIFSLLAPGQTELVLGLGGSQYQILDSLEEIAKSTSSKVKRFQYAWFVRREKVLLLWHDDVEMILVHAAEVERTLLTVVWGSRIPNLPPQAYVLPSTARTSLVTTPQDSVAKLPHYPTLMNGFTVTEKQVAGEESLVPNLESLDRPLVFISAIFVGLAIGLIVVLLFGFGTSELIYQSLVDGKWLRMALIATTPFFGLFGLFFVIVIFTDLFQVFGPVGAVLSNSRSYSAIRPNIQLAYKAGFTCPHVTIEMPVYKESLTSVIMPTVTSLKAAISHYELNGGTANIFIFDDGLQILPEEEADARRAFYTENSIGWVARPKHEVDGFVRGGKFKKASNMNYGLNISNRTEDRLQAIIEEKMRTEGTTSVSEEEEDVLLQLSLQLGRWYPSAMVMANGSILIVGGENGSNGPPQPSLEILPNPVGGKFITCDYLNRTDPYNLYPFLAVLPTGGILVTYYNEARILDPVTFKTTKTLPNIPGAVNNFLGGRTYPLEGTAVLFPQYPPYTDPLTVLICGGSTPFAQVAIDNCVTIQPEVADPVWTIERMPSQCVIPCIAALPDGTYLILNGAQKGVAGFGLSSDPNLNAVLYDPTKPLNSRMSVMASTIVARMYHSESTLLQDGRVLVSGSDPEDPNFPQEYRVEVFLPPYLLSGLARPSYSIQNKDWVYGESVQIVITHGAATRASLIGAQSSTHGNSMGQRTIFPEFSCAGNTCTITAPPNANASPPGWFMLFILDGPTPSNATWVRIGGDPAEVGNWPDFPDFYVPGV